MAPQIREISGGVSSDGPSDYGACERTDSAGDQYGLVASANGRSLFSVTVEQSPLFKALIQHGMNRKKIALLFLFMVLLATAVTIGSLYTFHRGFRRTCQFWTNTLPWITEYYWLKFHATYITRKNETEWQEVCHNFHKTTAPKAVRMVERMGGIYVKIGQTLSTVGSGILPEEYCQALRPLQDGVPPRTYYTIATIIEQSTGQKMEDIFSSFDEKPVGAATIAQAHRAVLKQPSHDGQVPNSKNQQEVIVKVQYPEVAELFEADLNNLELMVWLFMPYRSRDFLKNIRKRHERELDFRLEASHLEECSRNMQRHGLEPTYVRIPRVRNETGLCTKDVLVMEYLEGASLRDVIDEEQNRIARALGKQSGEELRFMISKRMKEHFEQGGGNAEGGTQLKLVGGGQGPNMARLWNLLGPFAIHGLRHYARLRERLGHAASAMRRFESIIRHPRQEPRLLGDDDNSFAKRKRLTSHRVNLGKALKTLIHVHGVQVLVCGFYNADSHPGNVLILRDGRLGLLDYGMVGRFSIEQRKRIASVVSALAENKPKEVARLYLESGYHITLQGKLVTDANILFRLASTYLDKIDLSPVLLSEDDDQDLSGNHETSYSESLMKPRQIGMLNLLESIDVVYVPEWTAQVRRVGRLMMGVSAQAARPISLAKEWQPIAKRVLRDIKQVETSQTRNED